jgi:hypothetical protein
MTALGDGLPPPSRGKHRELTDGACLMEYTAYLAGEPHSDRPTSVHPVLAGIAHVINDAVGDKERARLTLLAPRLIGTNNPDRALLGALIALCCQRGLQVALPIWAPRLRRELRRAEALPCSSGYAGPGELRSATATARIAAASLAIGADEPDDVLIALLTDSLELVESVMPRTTDRAHAARRLPCHSSSMLKTARSTAATIN